MIDSLPNSPGSVPAHILVACHAWYGDVIGGSFRLASEFAEHLAQQGYEVTYICCAPNNTGVPKTECVNGVNIIRYPPPPKWLPGPGRLVWHVLKTGKLVRRTQEATDIDAVSGHSPLQAFGAARAISHAHINYTVHSPFGDELLSNSGTAAPGLMRQLAAKVASYVDRTNVRLANVVQTASQYTQDVFQRRYASAMRNKGVVAPGWVDADRFKPAIDRTAVRHTLGDDWNTNLPVFFTLRRLENRMGLDTLIDACQVLRAEGCEFRTLIGGGGSLQQSLQRRIDESGLGHHVYLLGRLPEDQLAASYAAADCFVLPTRALECFGLIVLEALACETPVIASNVAAIPEVAEQQGAEWMFNAGNVQELADRMRDFVNGKLSPKYSLRDIALSYDRPKVLAEWERLVLNRTIPSVSG